jgi:phosphopantetheinyl transferase
MPQGKPYHEASQFNVSHTDGIVVLVGSTRPIGIDIVSCDISSLLPTQSWQMVFSLREIETLAKCAGHREQCQLTSVLWAFKEAFMKYVGVPDWDNIASVQFLDVIIPENGACVTNPVGQILIENIPQTVHTECHNINDTHFIAIYSPVTTNIETYLNFKEISLQDITPN